MMNARHRFVLFLILALISSYYVTREVVIPHIDERMEVSDSILSGRMEPPYQYRILKPLLVKGIQEILSPFFPPRQRHVISSGFIALASFFGIFWLFYLYLCRFFTERSSIIGILLLQVVIPLSVTGGFMIGDFIAVFFYLVGLNLIVRRKDIYLPIVMLVSVLNREQMIFLLYFYVAFLIDQGRLRERIPVIIACLAAFVVSSAGTRLYFGWKPSRFTIAGHLTDNFNLVNLLRWTIPLWLVEVAGFIFFSIIGYKRSAVFFRLSFVGLGLYLGLFIIHGNLWELAKFLPAFLVLIPMALQVITGETAALRNRPSVA